MRNVFRVFIRDVKRIARVPQAWLVVLFLIVLPSLYTWFNVLGFWDPYENTGNLRVCVVNEDAGAYDETLGELNLGDQVVSQLEENQQLGWTFVSRDEGMRQVESGEAYALFVIPESFSADVTTLLTGDFRHPQLEYYVNEKLGPVSPKITDTGASTLDTTINDAFVSTVSSTVAHALNVKIDEANAQLATSRGSTIERLDEAAASLDQAREALTRLSVTADEASTRTAAAKDALSQAKSDVSTLALALSNAQAAAAGLGGNLVGFSTTMGGVLDKGSSLLSRTSADANVAIGQAAGSVIAAQGEVDAAIARGQAVVQENEAIIKRLRALQEAIPDGKPGKEELGSLVSALEQNNTTSGDALAGLGVLSRDTAAVADSISGASESINGAVQTTLTSVDGYRATLSESVFPQASKGLAELGGAAGGLSTAVSNQLLLIDQTSLILDQLAPTLSSSSDAMAQTASLVDDLGRDLGVVRSDLAALGSADIASRLLGEDGSVDPAKIADFMMSPTQVVTEELYPLNAYGSAMAPLFINLTLWIGVFMLMVIMRIEVDDEGIPGLTIAQRFFGRGLLLAIIVSLQAIVCCAGCLAIGVQTVSAPAFFVTAVLCSLAYLSIQYTLSTTLQHVGKGICVILVFVQIPGATGLYPIEMTPSFYQFVYPLFPFTYGINAIRETIAGFYDGAWLHEVGILLGFLAAFLAIGVLLRPYVTNLNHLFARQIEQSDIINGEPVQLPARRFRVAQLIRVLSDREEYRDAIDTRVDRFMRLYPRFMWGALVFGIVVPVIATIVFAITETEKVVMLTGWLVWLVVIIAFLVIVEAVRDSLSRQVCLESMSDDEVRGLYAVRNDVSRSADASARRVHFKTEVDGACPRCGQGGLMSEGAVRRHGGVALDRTEAASSHVSEENPASSGSSTCESFDCDARFARAQAEGDDGIEDGVWERKEDER